MMAATSRRLFLASLTGASVLAQAPPSPVQHFDKIKWLEWPRGAEMPQALQGTLVVNLRTEVLTFFEYFTTTKRLQVPAEAIRAVRYELASKPSSHPLEGDAAKRFFGGKPRHYVTVEWATDDAAGSEFFELEKKTFGQVLVALEDLTGKPVQRSEKTL